MFQAKQLHLSGGWADKYQALCLTAGDKLGVLTEEAVAGVYRLGTAGVCGLEYLVHVQIRVGRAARAKIDCAIGMLHVE